jgi:hypothetical protein
MKYSAFGGPDTVGPADPAPRSLFGISLCSSARNKILVFHHDQCNEPQAECFVQLKRGIIIPKVAVMAGAVLFLAGPVGAQAAGSTMYGWDHASHQIYEDSHGVTSRGELWQFMDQTSKHLDSNQNGKLHRNESRPLLHHKVDAPP